MNDELQFKLCESPATEDERRQMPAVMASACTARTTFGAQLCAAIEQAAHIGEAFRLAHLREFADFVPAVESLRLLAAGLLAADSLPQPSLEMAAAFAAP